MSMATSWITRRSHPDGIEACIRDTNINVWGLVEWRCLGRTDDEILDSIPGLTPEDLAAAWEYHALHRDEIEGFIRRKGLSVN
jgi:type III restriction enzyme